MMRRGLSIACVLVGAGCGPEVRTLELGTATLHHVVLRAANVWVLDAQEGGTVMIDAGGRDDGDDIVSALEIAGIGEQAVDLVVLTHGHADHAGAGAFLRDELAAPIAVHAADAGRVRAGSSAVPEPQNLEGTMMRPFIDASFPAFEPDLLLSTSQRLDAFGIAGEVVHVPGHSPGSVAVLLDSGDVFIGDLARGDHEGSRGEHQGACTTHFFSDDHEGDRAALEALLGRGARVFYPGHGPLFDADTVRGWLEDTKERS